jgi:hypothetical protein
VFSSQEYLVYRRILIGLAAASFLPAPAVAQQTPWRSADHVADIPRAELDSITARGRLLAEYDAAAWHGTDAVMALQPKSDLVAGYLARRTADARWEVVFGRSSAAGDTFYVAYRAVQRAVGDTAFNASAISPATPETDYDARASRALDAGRREFGRPTRPYNAMVVSVGDKGEWYVYLVPAPTVAGVWPLGGDVRYRVSADGRTIIEQRRLHNAVIEFDSRSATSQPGKTLQAGSHSAVLADRPEDTDVFYVLTRQPSLPEYIVSRSYYFRIAVDGQIMAYDREK